MQNPWSKSSSGAQSSKPIVLSRRQLSVDAIIGKPRVTRIAPKGCRYSSEHERHTASRERARNLKRAIKDGSYSGPESVAIDNYLKATRTYESRKARR